MTHLLWCQVPFTCHLLKLKCISQTLSFSIVIYDTKSRVEVYARVFPKVRLLHLQLYVNKTRFWKRRVLNGSKNSYDCTGGEIVVISHNPRQSVSLEQKETLQWNSSLCRRVQRTTYNWVALWSYEEEELHTSTLIYVVRNGLIITILIILTTKKCYCIFFKFYWFSFTKIVVK